MKNSDFYAGIAFAVRMMSHEVRGPFTTMDMFLRIIENKGAANVTAEKLETCLGVVQKSRKNLNEIINDLLLFDPQVMLNREMCELADLAAAVPVAGVAWCGEWRHSLPIAVDKDKMVRVFNLILRRILRTSGAKSVHVSSDDTNAGGRPGVSVRLTAEAKSASPRRDLTPTGDLDIALCEHLLGAHGGDLTISPSGLDAVLFIPGYTG